MYPADMKNFWCSEDALGRGILGSGDKELARFDSKSDALIICSMLNDHKVILQQLIDITGMLDHYANGRRLNWDGSTKNQAITLIKEVNATIAVMSGNKV